MESYHKPEISKDALRVWWSKLNQFEFIEICNAFDKFTDMPKTGIYAQPPLPVDIAKICQSNSQRQLEHKITIHARLPSPLALAANKAHAVEIQEYVAKNIKPRTDHKKWARDILADEKRCTQHQIKCAKEALNKKVGNDD